MVWFWVERSKVKIRVRVNSNRRGFELYERLLVFRFFLTTTVTNFSSTKND